MRDPLYQVEPSGGSSSSDSNLAAIALNKSKQGESHLLPCHPPTELMMVDSRSNGIFTCQWLNGGWESSECVAEGGAGYFVWNGQVAEASPFFLPLLDCFLNLTLTIALYGVSSFGMAHGGVGYVESC